jgi:hypothetical protein
VVTYCVVRAGKNVLQYQPKEIVTMANPACQFEDGKTAVFIGTNLENGDTVTTCLEHMVEFFTDTLEGLAAAVHGEPSDEGEASLDDLVVGPSEDDLSEEFQEFIDANTNEIQDLVLSGETFERAVEILLERATEAVAPEDSTLHLAE